MSASNAANSASATAPMSNAAPMGNSTAP
jgi:hypothetical protein